MEGDVKTVPQFRIGHKVAGYLRLILPHEIKI